MSHKERRTVPAEAIELYNQYVHGEISRRAFLSRAQQFAVAGFTATTLVQALMPDYAMGQQIDRDDERIRAEYVTLPSPQGHGFIKGYLVRPFSADSRSAEPAKLPGIIVVHENRGLNPHTEDVARRLALANFMAFAPDVLTSVGGYPGDDYQGGQLFNGLDAGKRFEDIVASALWLKNRADCTGKICATGFCYGGGIANTLAVRLGADLSASAPFYGGVPQPADVPKVKAAILVHHGELDIFQLIKPGAWLLAKKRTGAKTQVGHLREIHVRGPVQIRSLNANINGYLLGNRDCPVYAGRVPNVLPHIVHMQGKVTTDQTAQVIT